MSVKSEILEFFGAADVFDLVVPHFLKSETLNEQTRFYAILEIVKTNV